MKNLLIAVFAFMPIFSYAEIIPDTNPPYVFYCPEKTKCTLIMSQSIAETSEYLKLGTTIREMPSNIRIDVYLDGYGGDILGMLYLCNSIKYSKAEIVGHVVGPVYSAHAMLLFSFKEIVIDDDAFLMLHRPAIFDPKKKEYILTNNDVCDDVKGLDRGKSMRDKCILQNNAINKMYNKFFEEHIKKFLTEDELSRYQEGYDVYINGTDMQKRIEENK
jgi:Protease subunit of ATP-dependent Clp proteases